MRATKQNIIDAYAAYQRKEPRSGDLLLELVTTLCYVIAYPLEHQFKHLGTAETADDWAQQTVIKIWRRLETFAGTGEEFYAYAHQAAENGRNDGTTYFAKQSKLKAPLMMTGEDDDGELSEFDNPAVNDLPRWNDAPLRIPDSITDQTDRAICRLILDGLDYQQIGEIVGMSDAGVESRLRRIRKKFAGGKPKQEAA